MTIKRSDWFYLCICGHFKSVHQNEGKCRAPIGCECVEFKKSLASTRKPTKQARSVKRGKSGRKAKKVSR